MTILWECERGKRRGGFERLLFAEIRLIRGFDWNGRRLPLLQRMDTPRAVGPKGAASRARARQTIAYKRLRAAAGALPGSVDLKFGREGFEVGAGDGGAV